MANDGGNDDGKRGEEKRLPGRPSKLTPEFEREFLAMLRAGKPQNPSLLACGVDDSTFRKWRVLARNGDPTMVEFFTQVARARADGELHHWGIATKGDEQGVSNGPAKCAQWALEKQFGPRYQPRVAVKVEAELESFLDDVARLCSEKDCGCYEAILAAHAARASGETLSGVPGEESSGEPSELVH